MADMAAAAAAPPLVSTPTPSPPSCGKYIPPPLLATASLASRRVAAPPPLLPTPASRRPPLPASAKPSASKLSRAAASGSWIRDKAARRADIAPPPDVPKIPGRASLSDSWILDKAQPAPSSGSSKNGCCKRSCAPSAFKYGKKPRFHSLFHQVFSIKVLKDMLGKAFMLFIVLNQVKDIPSGTKVSALISFDKIEVVNRLRKEFVHETLLNYGVHYDKAWIYDKIHHEITSSAVPSLWDWRPYTHIYGSSILPKYQIDERSYSKRLYCTCYAPGIEIISVRVTKPNIPGTIRRNFEIMEEKSTNAVIATTKQKVTEKEAETQKKIALSEAEKNAQVSKILMEQKLMEKDSSKKQQQI
ncbi:hypothetical protein EJB05_06085, partial [Eragrostis curvula]